jgi:hypothetical protein
MSKSYGPLWCSEQSSGFGNGKPGASGHRRFLGMVYLIVFVGAGIGGALRHFVNVAVMYLGGS